MPLMVLVRPFAHGWMALAHIDRGELDAGASALVGVPDEEQDAHFTYNWALFARGRLALARGRAASARSRTCSSAAAASSRSRRRTPACCRGARRRRSRRIELGRAEQARELADEELQLARAFGSPRALGVALRAAGLVAGGGEGLALLERGGRGARALAGAARARARARRPRRRAARGRSAHGRARDAARGPRHRPPRGRDGLAGAARARSSSRPARARGGPRVRGTDALTPSERRVAELAERGLTNREIAQALFVSTKTVEFHLRNAYFKLRIRSRSELPAALRVGSRRRAGAARPVARQARP